MKSRKLKNSVLYLLVFTLLLSTTAAYGSPERIIDRDTGKEEYILPDFGFSTKPISDENIELIHKSLDEINLLDMKRIALEQGNNDDDAILSLFPEHNDSKKIMNRINDLQNEILSLGAYRLTEEQKLQYVYGNSYKPTDHGAMNTISSITPPPVYGIDFVVYYSTIFPHSGGTYEIGTVIATPTPNTDSKMDRNFDEKTMYQNIKISELILKYLKIGIKAAIGSLLPNGVSLTYGAVVSILEPAVQPSQHNNFSDTYLRVVNKATVVHKHVKVGNQYYFRVATNKALVTEMWDIVIGGIGHQKTNYFTVESNYYNDSPYATTIGTNISHSVYLPYESKNILGFPFVTLDASPWHASLPLHFAS